MVEVAVMITLGVFIGIFGFIILKMLWNIIMGSMWPISVSVGMQRGNSIVWDIGERARLVKSKDGYQCLRLKKRKQSIKPPQYKYLTINDKGRPYLALYNTTLGQYWPIQMPKPPNLDIVEDASAKNWGIQELKRLNDVYKPKDSWWNKYGTFIMSAILAATIIFAVMFFALKMEVISGNFNGAAKQLSDAMYVSRGLSPPGAPLVPVNATQTSNQGLNILGLTLP